MKMKTKLVSLCLVVLLTVFLGCSEDIYENSTSHSNAQKEKYYFQKGYANFSGGKKNAHGGEFHASRVALFSLNFVYSKER